MSEKIFADVKGVIDVHCHAGMPSCDTRPFTDVHIAQLAAAAGMGGLVLKSHYENTVARAFYVNQIVPDINIFGGIALNTYVGGLNPVAVEATLAAGGKEVWMPGIDSAHHVKVFGSAGSYEVDGKVVGPKQLLKKREHSGLRVIENGKLKKEAVEIVQIVAKHDAFFTGGHLFKEEIFELASLAKKEGAKMLVDHAVFEVPGYTYDDIDELKELADLGAYIGLFSAMLMPCDLKANIQGDKMLIETIGADHCVMGSDCGAAPYPIPNEGMRVHAQNLLDIGVSEEDLHTMMVKNPSKLLSL